MEDLEHKTRKRKAAPKGWKQDVRPLKELYGSSVEEPKKKRKLRLAPVESGSLEVGELDSGDHKTEKIRTTLQINHGKGGKMTPAERKHYSKPKSKSKIKWKLTPLEKKRKENDELGQYLLRQERKKQRGN